MQQKSDSNPKESVSAEEQKPVQPNFVLKMLNQGALMHYWNDLPALVTLSCPARLRSDGLTNALMARLQEKTLVAWLAMEGDKPAGLITTWHYDDSLLGRKNYCIFTYYLPDNIPFADLEAMFEQLKKHARMEKCTHFEAKTENGRLAGIMKMLGFNVAWRVGELPL